MKCVVFKCNSSNRNKNKAFRFYSFPKDTVLLKKWISFCRRKDNFNLKTSRICSVHFSEADIERNMQFEMGLCKQNAYKLKPGTVPSVNPAPESSNRSSSIQTRRAKKPVSPLLGEGGKSNIPLEYESEPNILVEKLEFDSSYAEQARSLKGKVKRRNLNENHGEPAAKRFKESSPESSSSDDDDSFDSDDSSDFDFFSSSSSDSESSNEAYSSSNDPENVSDSDGSLSQDDISIKDEPIFESDPEFGGDEESQAESSVVLPKISNVAVTIKTEVLDSIVDAVEVDSKTLLGPDVQVKEEPIDPVIAAVEIKEEAIQLD